MDSKIDKLKNQLHPSETPETKDDIEAWLNGAEMVDGEIVEKETEEDDISMTTPESKEGIEAWLNDEEKVE